MPEGKVGGPVTITVEVPDEVIVPVVTEPSRLTVPERVMVLLERSNIPDVNDNVPGTVILRFRVTPAPVFAMVRLFRFAVPEPPKFCAPVPDIVIVPPP